MNLMPGRRLPAGPVPPPGNLPDSTNTFSFLFPCNSPHSPPMSKPALGRGLGALLGGTPGAKPTAPIPPAKQPVSSAAPPASDTRERVLRVKLELIKPSPLQPRKDFT